jgi:hypothetical protein
VPNSAEDVMSNAEVSDAALVQTGIRKNREISIEKGINKFIALLLK